MQNYFILRSDQLLTVSHCECDTKRRTMDAFRWIKLTLFQIIMLQYIEAARHQSFVTIKAGDGDTLSCENAIQGQINCDSIEWTFTGPGRTAEVWFIHGNFTQAAKGKTDRLSVTADCSLNMKMITVEEAGEYTCRQIYLDQQYTVSNVYLSVVTIAEQRDNNKVTLDCVVSGQINCRHTVEWLCENKENVSSDLQRVPQVCQESVTFQTSYLHQNSKSSRFLRCKVTEQDTRKVRFFALYTLTSDEIPDWPWWYILLGLAASLIIVLAVIRWKKTTRQRGQMEQMEARTVDSGDIISYAFISFTRKPEKKAKISNTVTYSSVKTSSFASGASSGSDSIYSTIR
ncbi:uncharacterized protein LOC124882248 isoform X2 [Girardinichthys multiradiatus]|uniref:uncharacterized protein LOC124882248 isoform X2 n=1 Tax=Girardinichthys multiradiatus TaxID=208333 RepID=UPI001FACB744|nr:uncharacterized protein LOC124882248 isoform X2 [Girardinichthys multiradiatus]